MNLTAACHPVSRLGVFTLLAALSSPLALFGQTIRFTDVTSAAGIPEIAPGGFGHGTSFGDYNGDGRPDIYVMAYDAPNFLLRNNGNGTFTDIAASAGVQNPMERDRGMASADYDNDGDLDIFILGGSNASVLYRNNGNNTFTEVTDAAGVNVTGQGQGVAWGDYNNDGQLDLFVTQTNGDNVLFRQNINHTFEEVNASSGIGSFSQSLQPIFFDVDLDGDLDLFVVRQTGEPNLLYINNGNGTFSERASSWGIDAPAPHSQGAAIGDYDRDGDFDVYICNYDGENLFFRNNGQSFTNVTQSAGVTVGGAGNRGVLFADFNDDGWPDLYITRNNENKMFQNNGDGTFTNVSSASGANNFSRGYSPSYADYDNDGDLDIFFSNTGQDCILYRNDGPLNNWLQIKLIGESSNRDGVGARVIAWASGQKQTQMIVAGQAYLCTGSDLTAHFGLGAGSQIDSLIVQWPAGLQDRYYDVAANQKLTLREGEGEVEPPADAALPLLSNIASSNILQSSVTIVWNSNEASDSQVEYGLTAAYGSLSTLDANRVTSHAVTLTGLAANTLYHYRVLSRDAAGNLAISGDFTFITLALDALPPVISNVTSGNIASSSAQINWNTDEASTGQVEFGLTSSYGNVSPLNPALVTAHSVTLTGLNANTTYHYRVLSEDASGNLETSGNFTFTTSDGPLLSDNFNSASLDLTKWILGSQTQNISAVQSGVLRLRTTGNSTGWVYTRDKFSGREKTIQIKVVQPNNDGSLGMSPTATTAAANGFYSESNWYRFYNYRDSNSQPFKLFVQWRKNGVVGGLDVAAGVTFTSNFYLRLRTSGNVIYFEYSFDNVSWTTAYSETFALPGYTLDDLFAFELAAYNTPVKGEWVVDDFSINSLQAPPPDLTPPVISNVASGNITQTSATITWNTDEASDAQVEYGLTAAYGASSPLDANFLTAHSVVLSGLTAGETYHYRVKSRDAAGNLAASDDFTFTTLSGVPELPVISNVAVSDITQTTAQVSFTTDRNTLGTIEYDTQPHGVIRLMPLGDSITEGVGSTNESGYRAFLYHSLSSFGSRFDFVGSLQYGAGLPDTDHEGHPGWSANQILGSLNTFLAQAQPQAVLLHIGTNDISGGNSADLVVSEITAIVDAIFQYNANTKIYLSTLIPRTDARETVSVAVNAQLPALVNARANSGYRIHLVDNHAAFLANPNWALDWMADNLHPNDAGYEVMSNQWWAAYVNTEFDFRWHDGLMANTHAITLAGLQPATTYHYRARALDANGNASASSDATFTTASAAADTAAPVITTVAAGELTAASAKITWNTDEASDSQVEFGLTNAYGALSGLDTARVTSHSVTLVNLAAGTTYHYRVRSKDAAGNLAVSGDFTFATPANDVTPPVITNVAVSNISGSSARLTWLTDEPGDSQVDYGLSVNYGQSSALSPSLVTNHTILLSGLLPGKTYHYRVKSRDASANLGVSGDFTFTTLRVVLEDDFNTAALDTTKWLLGSHSGNQTAIVNNALRLRSSGANSGWIYTRDKFSGRNKIVQIKVVQPNNDGALGMSATVTRSALNGFYNEPSWYRFYNYRSSSSGPYKLYVQWRKNNVIDGRDVATNAVFSTNFHLRLRTSADSIYFEYSYDNANWVTAYSEIFALTGYSLDSQFAFELSGYRSSTNGEWVVDDFAIISTEPDIDDVTPPVISNIAAGNVTANDAVISWNTNEASDSQVEYGLTAAYGSTSLLNPALVTAHSVALSGLTKNTTYHYRVLSQDASGNLAASGDQTFQTGAAALTFTDITLAAGTGGPSGINDTGGHAAIFADVDNDALPDLYITMYNVLEKPDVDLFYRNTGGNVFTSEAAARGIADFDGGSHGALFADLDHDGDFDLYNGTTRGTTGIPGINNLFRNNGNGFFTDVTTASGLPLREWETRSVTAFDMDNDGDLDLFAVTDYLGTTDAPEDRNEVYRNDGDLQFTAINSGALYEARAGQGAIATDYDGDGDLDIIAANRTGDLNILRNEGQGSFSLASPALLGISHRAGDGITTADLDNDGRLDLLLASDNVGYLYLSNANGTFRFHQSFDNTDGYMAGVADLDNDGDLDIVFAGDDVCYLSNGAGTFVAGPSIPVAGINDPRAIGFADIDNDGDLDFAVGCKRSRNWLVRNNFNDGNWLKVRLVSPQGVAGAFGAKTRIYPAGQAGGALVTWREARSGAGYLGQDDPVLHFGLGALDSVDVVVTFLDGTQVTAANVTAGQTIVIDGVIADTTKPVLSSVTAANLTGATAQILWNTSEISDSQVEYGLTTNYGVSSPLNSVRVTAHNVALSGLTANTTYHYRVKSKDRAGNLVVSGDFTFATATPDATPPVISNVATSNITSSSVQINWNTNEASDSQVEYGLTNSYGSSSPLDANLTTTHNVTLSGLSAGTTYHYRVKSKDATGNLATSGDFTFTTLASALFADDFNSGSLDANKWTRGTNAGNQTAVAGGQLELRSQGGESGWVITKQAFAARNTTITAKVTQPNDDGALGISPTFNQSATTGIYNQATWYRFYIYRDQASGPYLLYVQWKKNGAVDGVEVTGNLNITGQVFLRLRCDDTRIHFEASLDGATWFDTYNEPFGLTGYTLDSNFYYELAGYRTSTKGVLRVDDFSILTGSSASGVIAMNHLAKPRQVSLSIAVPESFALSQNYPNPFNIDTRFNLALPEDGRLQASIYNLQGQEVMRLHEDYFSAGYHVIRWQGANDAGQTASSGIYILRLIFEGQSGRREVMTTRMILLK